MISRVRRCGHAHLGPGRDDVGRRIDRDIRMRGALDNHVLDIGREVDGDGDVPIRLAKRGIGVHRAVDLTSIGRNDDALGAIPLIRHGDDAAAIADLAPRPDLNRSVLAGSNRDLLGIERVRGGNRHVARGHREGQHVAIGVGNRRAARVGHGDPSRHIPRERHRLHPDMRARTGRVAIERVPIDVHDKSAEIIVHNSCRKGPRSTGLRRMRPNGRYADRTCAQQGESRRHEHRRATHTSCLAPHSKSSFCTDHR